MLAISFAIHLGAILMLVVSPWDFFRREHPPMVSYTVDLVQSDRLGGSAAPKSPPGAKPGVKLPPVAREGAAEKGKKPPQPKPQPKPEPARAKAEAEKKRADQAKVEAEKKQAEQVKAEAAKQQAEQAKAEAAKKKSEQAKAEAAKKQAEQAKALALKKKLEAEKKKAEADAAKKAGEAKKAEAAKAEAEAARKREEAAQAEAKKAEAKKAAEKAAAQKVAAEKAAKEKAEKEKAEKVAAEKAAAEKAEADAAKAEADAEAAREAIAAKLRDEHLAAAIEKLRGATAAENEVEGGTGLGGTGGGGVVQGLDFLLYKGVVDNTIRQNWAWAGDSAGLKVVVGFGIQADGRIVDLAIVEPSGDASYDNLALRAVQSSDPLPPPPEEYRGEFARYELELRAEDVGL
jgi:colicin import membrane protein